MSKELIPVVEPIKKLNELIFQSEYKGEEIIYRFQDLVSNGLEVGLNIKSNFINYKELERTLVLIDKE